jgi:hypothetical protein
MGDAEGNLENALYAKLLGLGVSREMSDKQPNPGSPEAVEKGCLCPVMDNHGGKGFQMGEENGTMFWMVRKCPLHGNGMEE